MSLNPLLEKIFQEKEIQLLKEQREKHVREMVAKEREEQKKLHYMHCPKCGAQMQPEMMEHIEVDKCPECLGIYFDNRELEQVLELEFEKRRSFFRNIFGLK
jgi:hypothetical protein